MHKYKTLKRCHLPDLDLTVPACRGITWGRPLSQEEIDYMNAVLGVSHGQERRATTIDRMNAVLEALYDKKEKDV